MTNADTAVLTTGFVRDGYFDRDSAYFWNRTVRGYLWTGYAEDERRSIYPAFSDERFRQTATHKGHAMNVRCTIPSLIFSPEAMGWPREALD